MSYRIASLLCMIFLLSGCWPSTFRGTLQSDYLGKQTIDSLEHNGSLKLECTTIKGTTTINGTLYAHGANLGSLNVNGQTKLNQCVIMNETSINGFAHIKESTLTGNTLINGSLKASHSTFKGDLSIASSKITLKACDTQSIHVRSTRTDSVPTIIKLKNQTIVHGSIVFDAGNGQVVMSDNSIIEGKIAGGTIIKHN